MMMMMMDIDYFCNVNHRDNDDWDDDDRNRNDYYKDDYEHDIISIIGAESGLVDAWFEGQKKLYVSAGQAFGDLVSAML